MAPRRQQNPCGKLWIKLLAKLNGLNGFLHLLSWALEQSGKNVQTWMKSGHIPPRGMVAGSRLPISDLSNWPKDGWRRNYPTPHPFAVTGATYRRVFQSALSHNCAWSISQGYEAFETFLYDIAAGYLRANPCEADTGKLSEFELKEQNEDKSVGSFQYWRLFTKSAYTNNRKLLQVLRRLAPKLRTWEKKNNRGLDLVEWFAVVSEVRHAITHSGGLLKAAKTAKWNEVRYTILRKSFPGTRRQQGYLIRMSLKSADSMLRLLGEYAFLIFKALSLAGGYEWNILRWDTEDDGS